MYEGIKISQVRMPAWLNEEVSELAHRKRQSRNQFMVEGIRDHVEREKLEAV